jgi:hypothetical protein
VTGEQKGLMFGVLACKSAFEWGRGGEGGAGVRGEDLGLLRAVPNTAAEDDDLAAVEVNFADVEDDFATVADGFAAEDSFAAAAGHFAAVFGAADADGGDPLFLPTLALVMPTERFECIFADDGWPKLLLRALPKLLLLLPPPARGVCCRALPVRRAVEAPLSNMVITNSRFGTIDERVHLQLLSRVLLRREEEEEGRKEEEGVEGLTLQAAAPSSSRLTGPTSISAAHTSLYCCSSSPHIFSWLSCACWNHSSSSIAAPSTSPSGTHAVSNSNASSTSTPATKGVWDHAVVAALALHILRIMQHIGTSALGSCPHLRRRGGRCASSP